MSAVILPFERREPSSPATVNSGGAEPDSPRQPEFRPFAAPAPRLTSRSIAHRWAMLSHLARHYPRRAPDPIR